MRKRGSERWLRVRDLGEGDTYGEGQNFSVGGFVKIVASGGGGSLQSSSMGKPCLWEFYLGCGQFIMPSPSFFLFVILLSILPLFFLFFILLSILS